MLAKLKRQSLTNTGYDEELMDYKLRMRASWLKFTRFGRAKVDNFYEAGISV